MHASRNLRKSLHRFHYVGFLYMELERMEFCLYR